ncbi:MAG TPA: Mu-like prophage major head subunit gpT family protein [Gemmataceae bacterium]|nr:Mu-like prophage major head subunit gpT family protein [Gemmataceae bacterium]
MYPEFTDFATANGFDPATLTESQKATLQKAWRADNNPPPDKPPVKAVAADDFDLGESTESIEAKAERVAGIMGMARAAMSKFAAVGNVDKVKQIRAMAESATADAGVSVKDFQLELLRAGRVDAPNPYSRPDAEASGKVIEAAFCRRAGLPDLEKHFDAATLEASEHHFKRGLGLVGLLHHAAQRNGWRGMPDPQSKDFLRAAFGAQGGGAAEYDLRAGTTGPSTFSLPYTLGNIANKSLRIGFMGTGQVWSQIAAKKSVNNFQPTRGVAINGSTIYRTLAPSGEIKHATLSETGYANQASTYAIMLGINRESLINDDAGALTDLPKHIGRGAGLKINDLFWTAFLNNSSFFTSGNANVSTGGGSALGTADGAAINAAEQKFMAQTGADGYPIDVMPAIMLVPPTLANTAARWMGSQTITQGGTSGLGATNVYQGRYRVLTSPYMESSALTGNSTAAWYLLASPDDVPVIEGVALNGRWEPTVETADADFNQLGIAMRGFIDVGFALFEYRGGVRSAGS